MVVELIRAWPSRCESIEIDLAAGSCVAEALAASGWNLDKEFVGLSVFGTAATASTVLREGDRIELLRGLQIDPKQARRLRADRSGKEGSL
ncbi:MAG: RnfH family protein [Pseudomonadota bacterium]|nr:RnfH family protein [Pseudomonadota bacterium]MDQ3159404.1 RnfH family protein [Pseudomonadota bacterium]